MINKSDDSVGNNSLFRCCFVGGWRLSRSEAVSGVEIRSSELSRYAVVVRIL